MNMDFQIIEKTGKNVPIVPEIIPDTINEQERE